MGKRLTQKDFDERVQKLTGDSFVFLEPFHGVHSKLAYYHVDCGHFNYIEPNSFLHGHRCPYCYGNNKKTDEEFKQEVYSICGNHYKFLDKYKAARKKLRCKHIDCGFTWNITPNTFLSLGIRCPVCNGGVRYTTSQIQDIIDQVNGENVFKIISDNGGTSKDRVLKIEHLGHSHSFDIPYTRLTYRYYAITCNYCYQSSRGEQLVSSVLDQLNLSYIPQFKFVELKDKYPLSYDFYIPELKLLIEYQGLQHYFPVNFFGGIKKYNYQLKHDCMKKAYAMYHQYKLLTIPYLYDSYDSVSRLIQKYICKAGYSKE